MLPLRWRIDEESTLAQVFDEDRLREMSNQAIVECLQRTLKRIQDQPLSAAFVTLGAMRFYVVRAGGYGRNQKAVPELLVVYLADPRATDENGVGLIYPVCVCKALPLDQAGEQDREVKRLVGRTLVYVERRKVH